MLNYLIVTLLIFAVVACLHLVRLWGGWNISIWRDYKIVAGNELPMSISWIGFFIAIILFVWAIYEIRWFL
jgi:small-conductance mechanosensitive channel